MGYNDIGLCPRGRTHNSVKAAVRPLNQRGNRLQQSVLMKMYGRWRRVGTRANHSPSSSIPSFLISMSVFLHLDVKHIYMSFCIIVFVSRCCCFFCSKIHWQVVFSTSIKDSMYIFYCPQNPVIFTSSMKIINSNCSSVCKTITLIENTKRARNESQNNK